MTLTCRSSNSAKTEKGFELEWQACEATVSGQDGVLPAYLGAAHFLLIQVHAGKPFTIILATLLLGQQYPYKPSIHQICCQQVCQPIAKRRKRATGCGHSCECPIAAGPAIRQSEIPPPPE